MRVLLLGNYLGKNEQSMQRFAELMREGLATEGHEVRLLRPPLAVGRLYSADTGLGKWIGYIDQFVVFLPLLHLQVGWADVVHICDQANAVYIPHLQGKPHIITCHDMFAIRAALGEIRESNPGWTGKLYQRWILKNLIKAQSVACVSRQTEEEVKRVAAISSERLAVIPNALNYPYEPMPIDEAYKFIRDIGIELTHPFILHVGGNQWYKNRSGVLRVFSELIKIPGYGNHVLIMAGKPWTPELRQVVRVLGLSNRVIECVDVSNEELRALYSTADVLLFPSLQEGFGWPIVEAQACGCPVVTSNRMPMTEVSGHAAVFIDPTDAPGAAKAIANGMVKREQLRVRGLYNASLFSPTSMIRGYIECYHSVMSNASIGHTN